MSEANVASKNTIAKKILEVSRLVGRVEKNGVNSAQGFKYQAWEDVLPAVRNACIEVGLLIVESCDKVQRTTHAIIDKAGKEATRMMITVDCSFTFIDPDNDSKIYVNWPGESDARDDKAIQKAITSATKYCYLKMFQIPIKGDIDPDGDHGSEPTQSKPPTEGTKPKPAVDWKALIQTTLGASEQQLRDKANEHGLKLPAVFAAVYESNGNKTSIAEVEAALDEAIREKGKKK